MQVSLSTSSFLGNGVYVSTHAPQAQVTQSETSNQAEVRDSFVFNLNIVASPPSTEDQIDRLLESAKIYQRQAQVKAAEVKLEQISSPKPETEPAKSSETSTQKSSSTTSDVPQPQAREQDLSLDYARAENESAREAATRDFLTVGMSSRFVESQSTTTS